MAHDWYSIDGSDHDDSIRCRKCGAPPGYRPVLDPPCVKPGSDRKLKDRLDELAEKRKATPRCPCAPLAAWDGAA